MLSEWVDFHYDVNGETLDYSIEGGSAILLSDLFRALSIDAKASEVTDLTFSDPSLIRITRKAGDWELKSLKAFDTEELLTVTMDNGDTFTIRVTDAHAISATTEIDVDQTYIITYQSGGQTYVLKTDGSTEPASVADFDGMGTDYRWSFYYIFTEKDRETSKDYTYYFIRPVTDKSRTIALNEAGENLVQSGTNNVAVIPQEGGGFVFLGYNHTADKHIELGFENGHFVSFDDNQGHDPNVIQIYQQDPLERYSFTVKTADPSMGNVSGTTDTGAAANNVDQFISTTVQSQTNDPKNNATQIQATAVTHQNQGQNKWIFDYWDLDGTKLEGYGQTINARSLPIPHNSSVLTAHFKQNPQYVVPDSEKEGSPITSMAAWLEELKTRNIPLNPDGCDKTAEVYDYENRIYRVDMTAQSSLATFDGEIDLGFMLDVSGSMNFPSLLYESNDISGHTAQWVTQINERRWNGDTTRGERWGLKTWKTYYIIANKNETATVCYLYYYNGQWWLCDASKDQYNGNGRFNPSDGHSADNSQYYDRSYYDTGIPYVIYEAGDLVTQKDMQTDGALLTKLDLSVGQPKTRAFYLEKSMNGTLDELDEILSVLSIASNRNNDPDVKIAWNTFRNYLPNGTGQIQHDFVSASTGIDLSYDKNTYGGGTSTDAALLDAAGVNRNDINDRYSDSDRKDWHTGTYVSHTYTHDYSSGFQWNNSATKYAVLITDGAPQRNSTAIHKDYVKEAAQQLKNQGVELITVGLGMDNVPSGKILLYDIADNINDQKMFYSAKSGDELEDVLLQIVRQIMVEATVQGDVTDTINEAFYPVDKATGRPLEAGTMIDLNGNVTTDASKPHGTITYNNDTKLYGVEWTGQDFTWDGWHGSVYVKAKEDLLGGNAVKTNEGQAQIEAKKYKTSPNGTAIDLVDKKYLDEQHTQVDPKYNRFASLDTPRVNVNELSFTHNDTEWTVYLGTEVDPKTELRKLYDEILVEEVIKKGKGDDTDGDGLPDKVKYEAGDADNNWYPLTESFTDDRESEGRGDRNTFYLKDLIENLAKAGQYPWWNSSANDLDWDKFLEAALTQDGITIPYDVYGLNDGSNINIKLEKKIVSGEEADLINRSPHATTVTGDEVEKYTLTVLYSPDYDVLPKGQGGSGTENFHVGTYGTMYQGHAAGTETSANTHIINVFAKALQITKVDPQDNVLTGAKFTLYRTARSTDDQSKVTTPAGLTGDFFPVAELDASQTGVAVKDPVEQLLEGEVYYLVETKAPAGYDSLAPIPVELVLSDSYTPLPGSTAQNERPASGLFNWTQAADLRLTSEAGVYRTDANNTQRLTNSGQNVTSENDTAYFRIVNNPGVELPQAGGSGTTWLYLLGALLTLLSGVVLIARRRTAQ